jgi:hypothetical protein
MDSLLIPIFHLFLNYQQTRSGKIMRRILRKIAAGEEDSIGDTSTLADPSVSSQILSLSLSPSQMILPQSLFPSLFH